MKMKNIFWIIAVVCILSIFYLIIRKEIVGKFQFVQASAEDILKLNNVDAIFVTEYSDVNVAETKVLLGDRSVLKKAFGKDISLTMVLSRDIALSFLNATKNAIKEGREKKQGMLMGDFYDSRIIYFKSSKGYVLPFGDDGKVVFTEFFESSKLKKQYIDTFGFLHQESKPPGLQHKLETFKKTGKEPNNSPPSLGENYPYPVK